MKTKILLLLSILIILSLLNNQLLSQPCMPAGPISPSSHVSVDPPTFVISPAYGSCQVNLWQQIIALCPPSQFNWPTYFYTLSMGETKVLLSNSQWNSIFPVNVSFCWGSHTNTILTLQYGGSIMRLPAALSPVTLISPANGLMLGNTIPLLDWGNLTEATSYKLQIYTDAFCTNVIFDSTTNLDAMTISARKLTAFTKYYWRVKPYKSGGEGPFCDPYNFTTGNPPPFGIISPPIGSIICTTTPLLAWDSVPGAIYYRVRIQESWYNVILDLTGITSTSMTMPPGLLYTFDLPKVYDMTVDAYSSAGRIATAIGDFTLTIVPFYSPYLGSPSNGSSGQSLTPQLLWGDWAYSLIPINYQVQVSQSPVFDVNIIDSSGITILNMTVPSGKLSYDGLYYWRVRNYTCRGYGNWSYQWNFTTLHNPALPYLLSPPNQTGVLNLTPVLDWSDVANATKYRIQVSQDINFNSTLIDNNTVTSSQFTIPTGILNIFNNYYWRVSVFNGTNWTDFTLTYSFMTVQGIPLLIYPANNATGLTLTFTLDWNDVPSAENYSLQLSTSPDFQTPLLLDVSGVTSSEYQIPQNVLVNRTTYYWRVRAHNSSSFSEWSEVRNFFTTVDGPGLISPVNNAIGQSLTPVLDWNDVQNALSYSLQLSAEQSFNNLILNQSGLTVSQFTIPSNTLTNNIKYYWRVRTIYTSGPSEWSAVFNFTTIIAPPVLVSPLNESVDNVLTPMLDWNDVSGATGYKVQVSKFIDFSALLCEYSELTESHLTLPENLLTTNTLYYWRVNATNSGGTSVWSSIWSFKTLLTPQEKILSIISTVDSMQNVGILNNGNANSLKVKLNNALDKINRNQFNAAINMLNSFTNEVQGYINSAKLTQEQGQNLIDRAIDVINMLSGDNAQLFIDVPKEYKLFQNYPNPFNPTTLIKVDIPKDSYVKLVIYDILGREVTRLIDEQLMAGYYDYEFNASSLSSGIYFYRLIAGDYVSIKKMLIIK